MKLKLLAIAALALSCASNVTWAEESPAAPGELDQQAGMQRRPPPPEAFTACDGKAAGVAASFTNPRGEVMNGVCETGPSGKLVLRPDKPADGQPAQDAPQPPSGDSPY